MKKDVKLGDLSITTTYAGDFAGEYIKAALYACPTIANGVVTVKDNVKYKRVVKKVAVSGGVLDASCDFTTSATVTLTERILQPKQLQINKEICKNEMSLDWESVGYGLNDSLPPKFSDFIIATFSELVANDTEVNIWMGSGATTGDFNGLCLLVAQDSTALIVTGTTVASTTIVTELAKIVDKLPATLIGQPDLVIALAPDMFRAYIRSLGGYIAAGVGGSGTDTKGSMWYSNGTQLTFEGIRVVLAPGMTNGNAFAFQTSNVWYGTDVRGDWSAVKILDMGDLDGSDNIRVVMRWTSGVQYGISTEIVWYAAPASIAVYLPVSRT